MGSNEEIKREFAGLVAQGATLSGEETRRKLRLSAVSIVSYIVVHDTNTGKVEGVAVSDLQDDPSNSTRLQWGQETFIFSFHVSDRQVTITSSSEGARTMHLWVGQSVVWVFGGNFEISTFSSREAAERCLATKQNG